MPPVVINVDSVTRAAKQYDPLLKTLPYLTLDPVLTDLGINLLEVGDGDNIETTFERRGGLVQPYAATTSDQDGSETEIGKFVEMSLKTQKAFAAIKDHIDNYTSDVVVMNNVNKVDQQAKKHPLEALILQNKVITIAEDQIDALFHSERNISDKSPMGISDGYFTLMDKFVVSGDIAEAKGNYNESGAIVAPATESDYTAFKNLVTWLRSADPILRKQNVNLYLPGDVLMNVRDAAANKFRYISDVNINAVQQLLREHALIPNLNIKTNACLGSGTRIFLAENGLLDYGMNLRGDAQYIQVRSPYADPNWVQFWAQFKVGQRIKSLHRKKFFMNEGTTVALSLSGDYVS